MSLEPHLQRFWHIKWIFQGEKLIRDRQFLREGLPRWFKYKCSDENSYLNNIKTCPASKNWDHLHLQSLTSKLENRNLPAMQETWNWSFGWEDPLEKGMATHASILAWRIPMDREAWWATIYEVTKIWTWLSN